MAQASKDRGVKPDKPYEGFPLYAHNTGRWAKKVKGVTHFFGPWRDPDGALAKWNGPYGDDIRAGRKPREHTEGELTLSDLCNSFLLFKKGLLESGELAKRTWDQYFGACELLVATFSRHRAASDIQPEDFQKLRGVMAAKWGPVRLGNQIQSVRSVFKYGFETGLLTLPVRFGPGFQKPSEKTLRIARNESGPKLFVADDIRAILKKSPVHFKAMVLLAINGGMGNTDVALLKSRHLDLEGGWANYPRPKTGMKRRVPLWPETVAALKAAIAARPNPKNPDDAELIFIGPRGQNFIGNHKGYRVTAAYDRAAEDAAVDGRTFYDLRRTFQTIGEGAHDLVAVQNIMGHAPEAGDMSARYRQHIEDSRLKAVTDHVRAWLYPPEAVAEPAKKVAKPKKK